MMAETLSKEHTNRWDQISVRGRRVLENLGVISVSPDALNPLEDAMPIALPHVQPPDTFRQALADNLSLAAHGQNTGPEIARPSKLRDGLAFGIAFGLVLAIIVALILLLHSQPARTDAEPE